MGPWAIDAARGQALFVERCQRCHGENGGGGYGPPLDDATSCGPCGNYKRLWSFIEEAMPFRNPEACDATCARDIAAWIQNGFSTAPSCSVEFEHDSVSPQAFHATIRIFNFRGQDVPAWRLGFSLPLDHDISVITNALMSREGEELVLRSPESFAGIPDGSALLIGVSGSHAGVAHIPGDLRLEAPPCFAAPSATATP